MQITFLFKSNTEQVTCTTSSFRLQVSFPLLLLPSFSFAEEDQPEVFPNRRDLQASNCKSIG